MIMWAFSNSWVASWPLVQFWNLNVNAQYMPTSSSKASCSILMLKCKRVRSPRQRSLWYSSLELRVAKQTTQLSAFFLTNSQYFSDICRIFLEYFWNVSKIPQQARQFSRLLPNILATVLSRWRQTNSRHDLWAERQSILTSCFSSSISLANQNLVWADPLRAFPPALKNVSKKNISCWTDVPKTINGYSFWRWLLKGDDTAHFFSFDSSFDEKVWKHLFFLCAIPDLLAVEVFAWIIEERATR